jgi:hypothetical protein
MIKTQLQYNYIYSNTCNTECSSITKVSYEDGDDNKNRYNQYVARSNIQGAYVCDKSVTYYSIRSILDDLIDSDTRNNAYVLSLISSILY